MTQATTQKAITVAALIALGTAFSSTASAHDISRDSHTMSSAEITRSVSKKNAKNLVNTLLKKEYGGEGLSARSIRKEGDVWKVKIKRNLKTVATATVDAKTGNINVN